MATRTYSRPAQNALTAAKRDQRVANLAMGRHYTTCWQCSRDHQDFMAWCDTGWTLAKAATRAAAAVRQLEDAARNQPQQGTLW